MEKISDLLLKANWGYEENQAPALKQDLNTKGNKFRAQEGDREGRLEHELNIPEMVT